MKNTLSFIFTICSILVLYSSHVDAQQTKFVTKAEMKAKAQWLQSHLQNNDAILPFSFVYDGKPSAEILKSWNRKAEMHIIDNERTEYQISWIDPVTELSIKCIVTEFSDYPVIEWTVYFKNMGGKNTPILSDIQGLNTTFERDKDYEFILHGNKGDYCTEDSYEPFNETLTPNKFMDFSPKGNNRSSDGPKGWPYYNLQMKDKGIIIAIGWPGRWASSFTRDAIDKLTVKAGLRNTNCYLKPGEEIRTPHISMLFWKNKDIADAQNLWRRYYIAHIIPSFAGQPQQPILQIQVSPNEKDTSYVQSFLDAGIKPDICWRDAGWYPHNNGHYEGNDSWMNTGIWEIDTLQYPHGFKVFSDWVHRHGMQFLVWFEPEHVGDMNSPLAKNHIDWLLPSGCQGSSLNEGIEEAREWLTNHIDRFIKTQGLDWYREDMNCSWQKDDEASDRIGITENMYVQGHLAHWDALKQLNPKLHIDACASGGRRNDLETMKRAVPLLRSDFQWPYMKNVVRGNQGHTYGLSSWFPFQGTGVYYYDKYSMRSFYLPGFGMGGLTQENTAAQKQAYSECSEINQEMLFGDYYPMTPYSIDAEHWIGWQFNRPETGMGFVQAFRRDSCKEESITFHLRGLEEKAQYEVIDFDSRQSIVISGKGLMEDGLQVMINDKPGSAIYKYKKK